MKATKQTTDKGYVVYLLENHTCTPLRNFGWYQSAAIEFCNIINNFEWEHKDDTLERWKNTYNPNELYTYPTWTPKEVILKKIKTI